MVSKNTHVIIQLVEELEDDRWEAKIVEQNGNRIKLSVNSHAKAVIGKYKVTVTVESPKGGSATTRDPRKDIVMLFNPWCEGKDCWEMWEEGMREKGEKNRYWEARSAR
jgi:hypothetical protein